MSELVLSGAPVGEGLIAFEPEPSLQGGACAECGARCFPIRSACPSCQGRRVEPVAVSRIGNVYTFTVVHAKPPGYEGPVPYGLGVVELPQDGIRITTTLTADDLEQLAVGDEVEFELLALGDGEGEGAVSFAYRRRDSAGGQAR
jgi:uncharacterized OB-fold protein